MLTPDMQAAFVSILKEELVPATGCTEPIAIAYCAAKMLQVLGALPEKILVEVSGNILKNAKSVVVPNTGGMKGVQAAAAACTPFIPPVLGTTTLFAFFKILPDTSTRIFSGRAPNT